jgi:hypothetical protein
LLIAYALEAHKGLSNKFVTKELMKNFSALVGFVIAWLAFQAVVPYLMFTWRITGDEPHYLMLTHSLVTDGDFDLANNYAKRDYAAFYWGELVPPHVRVQPDGTQLLSHDVGLPILLTLPYALGGRLGVIQFLATVGALLVAQMILLGAEVSGRWWAGLLAGLAVGLSAPLGLYIFQIYPELAGGLILTWALRQILSRASAQPSNAAQQIFFALAVAALPWFSGRYAPLVLLLTALVFWPQRRQLSRASLFLLFPLSSLAAYIALNYALFGGPTPATTPAGDAVTSGFQDVSNQQVLRGLLGWWLDQHRGLLPFGPMLILAFIGLPHLWKQNGWQGMWLWLPIGGMWLLASLWGGFYSGWEVSAKFLMVGVPPLAASVAAALAGVRGKVRAAFFWPLAAGLLTLTLSQTVLMWLNPFLMLHESPVAFWEQITQRRLREYFPAAGTRYIEYPPAGEWRAEKGVNGYMVQSPPIGELSIGWYRLYAQAQLSEFSDANAVALNVDGYSSETGLPLFSATVSPSQADASGVVNISVPFYNPYWSRWNYPFYLDVKSSGAATVRLTRILFEPDPGPTYSVALAWVGVIVVLSITFAPIQSFMLFGRRQFGVDNHQATKV